MILTTPQINVMIGSKRKCNLAVMRIQEHFFDAVWQTGTRGVQIGGSDYSASAHQKIFHSLP